MKFFNPIYWTYLLIVIVFSLPTFVLLRITQNSFQQQIDLTNSELNGVYFLKSTHNLYAKILDQNSNPNLKFKSAISEFREASAAKKSLLKLELSTLIKNQSQDFAPELIIEQLNSTLISSELLPHSLQKSLINKLSNLIEYVGDSSSLVLDPDLDSYHLMTIVISKAPNLINKIFDSQVEPHHWNQDLNLIHKSIKTSITSDDAYYGSSPNLARNITKQLMKVDFEKEELDKCKKSTHQKCSPVYLANSILNLWRSAINELEILLVLRANQIEKNQTKISLMTITCWFIAVLIAILTLLREQKSNQIIMSQQASIINTSRLTMLGESAANIGHEINGSLSIIMGVCEIHLRKMERDDYTITQAKDALNKIQKSSARIVKIIANIKSASRNTSADPMVPVDIKEVINEVIDVSQDRLAQSSISIELLGSPKAIVCGRAVQLFQVLSNLVNNAIDAISHQNDKWIRIQILESNNNVKVILTDSGIGIPVEIAEKIMDPFFTTKPAGKGTGLGLFISARIVKEHGGNLQLNSDSSNTEFILELPKANIQQS